MREVPEMSERAREFLEHWVSDHVGAVADEYRMRETVRLVALCREDAIRAGIAPDELRTAAGGNLIQCIAANANRRSASSALPPRSGLPTYEVFRPSAGKILPNVP
jgi:hypothetical protein